MMLLRGYVSNNFGLGVIIPILKDKRGDLTSLDNYRPITLSPVISKIFESVLLIKYGDYLMIGSLVSRKAWDVVMQYLLFEI